MKCWYYRECWYKRRLKPYEILWVKFWHRIEDICTYLHRNFIYYGFFKQTKYFATILMHRLLGTEKYYCVWASNGVYRNKHSVCFFYNQEHMWDYCRQENIMHYEALQFVNNKREVILCYSKK